MDWITNLLSVIEAIIILFSITAIMNHASHLWGFGLFLRHAVQVWFGTMQKKRITAATATKRQSSPPGIFKYGLTAAAMAIQPEWATTMSAIILCAQLARQPTTSPFSSRRNQSSARTRLYLWKGNAGRQNRRKRHTAGNSCNPPR